MKKKIWGGIAFAAVALANVEALADEAGNSGRNYTTTKEVARLILV